MAEDVKRIEGPTEVGKGEYKPQSTMTPEQQAEAAKKHKAAQARARAQASKKYQPPPNVEPERLGGGLTEAEMNVKAPGPPTVVRQQARPKDNVTLKQEKPKKYEAPKAQLGRKGPGQMQRERAQVDVKTGKVKPTKTYGERAMSYLEGLGTKVAPPGSVTRLREKPRGPESTIETRLQSIGGVAAKSFPGREKASRPGGIINIPEEAAKTKGPSLKAQRGTKLAEYRRKQYRPRTAADVPGHGGGPVVPTGDEQTKVEVLKPPRKATETTPGHLGSYRVTGTAPKVVEKVSPRVEQAAPTRRKKPTPPAKPLTWWEKLKAGAAKAGTAFVKAGAEMQRESQKSQAPSGKYGTAKQAKEFEKGVKKAVVPKKFKE